MHESSTAAEPALVPALQVPAQSPPAIQPITTEPTVLSHGELMAPVPATVSQNTLASQAPAASQPQVVIIQQAPTVLIQQALDNRYVVYALLLFAGPLGLPALWFSGSFSKTTKIVTSFLYTFFTLILPIMAIIYFLEVSLWPLVEAFGPLN